MAQAQVKNIQTKLVNPRINIKNFMIKITSGRLYLQRGHTKYYDIVYYKATHNENFVTIL
jgi:hypothetical protein